MVKWNEQHGRLGVPTAGLAALASFRCLIRFVPHEVRLLYTNSMLSGALLLTSC